MLIPASTFGSVLDLLPEGIIISDPTDVTVCANTAAREMLSRRDCDLIGQKVPLFCPPADIKDGHRNGRQLPFHATYCQIRGQNGELLGNCAVLVRIQSEDATQASREKILTSRVRQLERVLCAIAKTVEEASPTAGEVRLTDR